MRLFGVYLGGIVEIFVEIVDIPLSKVCVTNLKLNKTLIKAMKLSVMSV